MEELGMTAGEFAEALKSPNSKNEKESREYVESFYDRAFQGINFKDLENKFIKIKTFDDSHFCGQTFKGRFLRVIDHCIWIDVFSPSQYFKSHQYIWLSDIEHIEEIKLRKYVKAKGRILLTSKATHELTETIVDGGYCDHTLKKGSLVTIGKEWTNWYGKWVTILDEQGKGYDIRPDKVPEVTKELTEQADTIQELCDNFVVTFDTGKPTIFDSIEDAKKQNYKALYGAIWTDKGLKYVGKENKNGELELL